MRQFPGRRACFTASANILSVTIQASVPVTEEPAAQNPLSEHPQPAGKRWCLHSINTCSGSWEVEAPASGTMPQWSPYLATWVHSGKESIAGPGHGLPAARRHALPTSWTWPSAGLLLLPALGRPLALGHSSCSGFGLLGTGAVHSLLSEEQLGPEDKSERKKTTPYGWKDGASLPDLLPGPCAVAGFTSSGGGGVERGRV